MATIEIDFDVYKALTMRRRSEDESYSDVLREVLELEPVKKGAQKRTQPGGFWTVKGVRFPAGTEFRANYKGQQYVGKVEVGGLVVNGERFDSPSAAAVAITNNPVNGWIFWECRLPGEGSWKIIKSLRN